MADEAEVIEAQIDGIIQHAELPHEDAELKMQRHPYGECCPDCATAIFTLQIAVSQMLPTIQKMGAMFEAIDSARETNPMVAKLFGFSAPKEPKESRKDRKSRLAEIQEFGEDDNA